jgi:ribonuclease-3 family protein
MALDLQSRSIRTLAWLGDVEYEREVRVRLVARGDYPTHRLDAIKALIVCAEAQAELLEAIEPALDDDEAAVVRRGRNTSVRGSARSQRNTKAYRAATGFEALIAHWCHAHPRGRERLAELVDPPLEAIIDRAIDRAAVKIRRG